MGDQLACPSRDGITRVKEHSRTFLYRIRKTGVARDLTQQINSAVRKIFWGKGFIRDPDSKGTGIPGYGIASYDYKCRIN